MTESLGQIIKNAKDEGKNVLVMALSAGIIKPEHEYSGEADRRALIEIIWNEDKFNPSKEEWKDGYQDEFMGKYKGDWQAMYVAIAKDFGVEISRGKALTVYMEKFIEVMEEEDESVVPGVEDSLKLLDDKGILFSLLSGQETPVINGLYLNDGDQLERYIDSALVQGGVIPSTPENIRDRAYGIITFLTTQDYDVDLLVLLDGNTERLANAGTDEWKQDLGIDVVKVGVKDDWVGEGLADVTDYQFGSMQEVYENLQVIE